jgi:hypothetical protein
MRNSPIVKNMLKYVPVGAVLVATLMGMLLGKDLYPTSLDFHSKTPTQLSTEPNSRPPLIIMGSEGPCGFSNIYTSLPPKCKTLEGEFMPVPGSSPYIGLTPGRK